MTMEILRLLMLYPHSDRHLNAMGFDIDDIAAYHYASLGEPDGVLVAAERGRRLEGLILLAPEKWPSVMLRCRLWSIRQLFLSPEATPRTVVALVNHALTLTDESVDFIAASIPTSDLVAIDGLRELGFRVVEGKDSAAATCRQVTARRTPVASFVPLEVHQLGPAIRLLRECQPYSDFESDPSFDADDLEILRHLLLFRHMQDPNAGVLVARTSQGVILGLVGYRMDLRAEEYGHQRIASIDYLAVCPDMQDNGLGEALIDHVMAEVHNRSIRAVSVSVTTPSPGSMLMLEMLRRSGYSLTTSRLTMHCWPRGSEWNQACDWFAA